MSGIAIEKKDDERLKSSECGKAAQLWLMWKKNMPPLQRTAGGQTLTHAPGRLDARGARAGRGGAKLA